MKVFQALPRNSRQALRAMTKMNMFMPVQEFLIALGATGAQSMG